MPPRHTQGVRARRPRARLALVAALLTACSLDAPPPPTFAIYPLWIAGSGDDNREQIDAFLDCLVHRSNLNQYWGDEARLALRPSHALPAPSRQLDWDELGPQWVGPQLGAPGGPPEPAPDETPVYLVFGGKPDFWTGACGRNGEAELGGRRVGMAVVRNKPLCWPTGDRLRTETQTAFHELAETVDRLLGHGACAAGGACRGRSICEDRCDTFVGLTCPDAPTGSWTGCDGGQVDGWVVQKLGYAGRDPAQCDACTACDFTPRACLAGEAGCGADASETTAAPPNPPRSLAWRFAPGLALMACLALALPLWKRHAGGAS